jgi:hypothetical protein
VVELRTDGSLRNQTQDRHTAAEGRDEPGVDFHSGEHGILLEESGAFLAQGWVYGFGIKLLRITRFSRD